jgi:hypothetical protein
LGGTITLAAFLALLTTALLAASAQAATYTVGTTEDIAGGCANPAAGTCSLRQLIEYEDARPPIAETETPDVISVPAGGYNLTLGELKITQTLVIIGAGARTTTVAESVPAQRVFEVAPPETGEKTSTVVISGLTISGGSSGYYGGDIYNKALLLLIDDWITGGQAISGGGISNDAEAGGTFHEAGTLVLRDSLVSGNHANAEPASGGGIQNHGARGEPGARAILVVEDSTVADNDASLGSGIYSFSPSGSDENQVSIINSTIAHNVTRDENGIPAAGLGAGLLIADGGANVFNSILAFNSEEAIPNNCATSPPGTITTPPGIGGYNIETGTDCNFTSVGDRQNTNPDFSSEAPQNNGGNTDTLGLNAGSPAIDAIPAENPFCTGQTDQRGLARPQGAGCDIGAFEYGSVAIITPPPPPPPPAAPPTVLSTAPPSVLTTTSATFTATVNPNGLPTTVHFEYGGVFGGATVAAITYGNSTPNQTLPADFANHTVTATVTGLLPNVTYHVRAVATNGAGNVLGPDQILQTAADRPPPPPVLGKTANVAPVSGVVYIELPPGATLASATRASLPNETFAAALPSQAFTALTKGRSFIPLTEARQIPLGSTLDTTSGVVRITTATTASRKGKVQSGDFGTGIFKLLQTRKQRGLTELNIIDNRNERQVCATVGKGKKASIASSHPSKQVLGHLTANSHGHFSARGQYSSATVRGTTWGVQNRCDGTLTRVIRGTLEVRDFRKRKTITLFTGQTYLARAPHA